MSSIHPVFAEAGKPAGPSTATTNLFWFLWQVWGNSMINMKRNTTINMERGGKNEPFLRGKNSVINRSVHISQPHSSLAKSDAIFIRSCYHTCHFIQRCSISQLEVEVLVVNTNELVMVHLLWFYLVITQGLGARVRITMLQPICYCSTSSSWIITCSEWLAYAVT